MSSEHDDDFVTADVYSGAVVDPSSGKCKAFFKKFFLVIITLGLIALAVMQMIWMSAAANFEICGDAIVHGDLAVETCRAIKADFMAAEDAARLAEE